MIATLDIADLGAVATARSLLRPPDPDRVGGLRWANVAALVPLAATRPPSLRRAAMVAFWDGEDAAREFAATSEIGRRFAGGVHASLEPLRAFGSWPGLSDHVRRERDLDHEGPVVVITLARLLLPRTLRFLRSSRPAERAAVDAPGMRWGTAATRPPFMMTISVWSSGASAATYAYGRQRPQHRAAIDEQARRDFHRESAFIRFAPRRVEGRLGGRSPLTAATFEP